MGHALGDRFQLQGKKDKGFYQDQLSSLDNG